MSERTDAQVLLRLALEGMRNASMPVEAILVRAGVDLARFDDSTARMPSTAQAAFFRAAEEVTGDRDFGLHLGEHLPVYRGQVIEYLFTSSPTFGDGLRRAMAFHRLISDSLNGRLEVEGDDACLAGGPEAGEGRHFAECFALGMAKFFASLTNGAFRYRALEFQFREGASPGEYERVFGCPVTLGASETRFHFDRAILDYRMWHAEPRLLRLHEQVANEQLDQLKRRELVSRVSRVIGETLESGEATLENVAERLDMPARRLRTELAELGVTFQELLEQYRSRLARRLLARTDEPIEQIVYLTGFAEPSTFYRAFKRWTNETPAEYRKRKRRGPGDAA